MSCPNIIGKPQIGYDYDTMHKYLVSITEIIKNFEANSVFKNCIKFGIKLPPYFDIPHFESASKIINQFSLSNNGKLSFVPALIVSVMD